MIVGIGTDIVDISRLENALARIGDRVFTAGELAAADAFVRSRSEHLAGRWAAKEALAKALGTGFGESCSFLDIEINNNEAGTPVMSLSGVTRQTFEKIGGKKLHLSISHEKSYATAFVIIEG